MLNCELLFSGKTSALKSIAMMANGDASKPGEKSRLAEVVSQAASETVKKISEDVMVMDTKLKIIEILQVLF